MLGQLGGDRHGQAVHRALAGRITGAAVVAEKRERARVHNGAALACHHLGCRRAAGGEDGAEVDVDQIAELLPRDVKDR
jgi:predicted short-subunit dehydrogenase-like oxidoreductase (DUF2520 family)